MAGRRPARIAIVVAFVIMATACAPMGAPDAPSTATDLTPRPVGTPAAEPRDARLSLPPMFEDTRVVDPGWDAAPQMAGGIYLGMRAGQDEIVFSAVSEHGTVLWKAERPVLCSAFIVSHSAGRPLAILMNVEAEELAFSETSVSAYDLRTGEQVWGPVEVPGPHVGPGLVFAAPPPASMGDSGPRMALDPGTGDVLADESAEDGLMILGEGGGIVVFAQGALLAARTADDQLWAVSQGRVGLSDDALPTAAVVIDERIVLLGDRTEGAALLDLTDGRVISHAARGTVHDASTDIRVILEHDLHGIGPSGRAVWSREVPSGAILVSAGNGAVYVRTGDGIHVFDTVSGASVALLRSDTVVPRQLTRAGAGIVGAHDQSFVLTARGHEDDEGRR